MARIIFLFLAFSISYSTIGQSNKSIEIVLYSRYDKHADYLSRFEDRTYTDPMKLWGASFGFGMSYFFPVLPDFKVRLGVGYYRLGVDKINRTSPWSSDVPARTIDFNHPTGILPVFHTDKYHYNNVDVSAGFRYEKNINKKMALTAGADFSYYYTFSQLYRITYDNTDFKTKNARTLGFGANGHVGMLKKFNRNSYYINPAIIIPIYQQLKGDFVFLEEESVKMKKWFNGIGMSFAVGKYF